MRQSSSVVANAVANAARFSTSEWCRLNTVPATSTASPSAMMKNCWYRSDRCSAVTLRWDSGTAPRPGTGYARRNPR